jgi:hypothetical protein
MQELLLEQDYVVCLSLETTRIGEFCVDASTELGVKAEEDLGDGAQMWTLDGKHFRRLFSNVKIQGDEIEAFSVKEALKRAADFPRVISLDWCIYKVKENKVETDSSLVIKPEVAKSQLE